MRKSEPLRKRKTASSVTTTSTASRAVSGNVHSRMSLRPPLGVVAVIVTITRPAPTTRSIAPPTPRTSFPGMAQLAMSPRSLTWRAPRTATSTWPPRIIAKLAALSKYDAPGSAVIGCLAASTRSGSSSSSVGRGPTPRRPFSVWRKISVSAPRWPGMRFGMPMPRFTTSPGRSSCAARAAISALGSAAVTRSPRDGRRRGGASRSTRGRARRPARSRPPRRS